MNWSAFFQGAPAGFSQGMDWAQRFNQNQQMNPLLAQHQQLQNQQLGQNISQGGTTFNREGNAFDAMMRQYMSGQGQGGQPGMAMPGQGAQGITPTARPQGQQGGVPSGYVGNVFAPTTQSEAWGMPPNAFSGMPTQHQGYDAQPGYSPRNQGLGLPGFGWGGYGGGGVGGY